MPIVLGRVYDSASNDRTDFGPGWKLTVAEEIRREGNIFRYTNSGNSEFILTKKSGSLISDYPSLTGIEAGIIEAGLEEGTVHSRWIALRFTSGLTKVFERIGDSYKLVKVSNKNGGGIKLNYEREGLQSITSQNRGQVILHRNRDGLITSATDDHGRSVQFTYDKKGRLAEFTDLGGGEWAYGYDEENNLVSVIDPRGSTILNATYFNGKTTEARILHDEMSFEYSKGSTRVSNSLNQEAIFWQHVSGLTEIAKGFGGDTTAIILDTDLKPLSLDYNGSTVADFVYSDSRLSQMVRRYNSDSVTEQYTYEQGQLSTVIRDDLVVAAYSYDNQGRLSGAVDDNGTRAYHYHNDGRIKSIISDGELYEVKTSSNGQIEQVGSDDSPWIGINYNPQGTVSRIDRTFSGQNMPLRFEYDERGFRIKANFNEIGDVDVTYDSVGGLTSVSYPKDGGRATEEYVVGENNELIEVNAEGKTGVRVEYDSVGRAINITRGSKIFAIQYDQPGRVTSVTLNGSPFLKRSYDTMDVDAVVSSDERTSYTTIPQPMVSSIFGSIDEIVYMRLRGAVYGPVRFDAKLSGFVLHASPVPDQSTLASFEKRMLTPLGRDFVPAPFTFDKPTNSLFVPPEYVSVNCMTCTASIGSTTLSLSTPLWAGTSGTLTGSTAGTCNFYGSDVFWTHWFTTGDGGSMSVMGNTASVNHTWNPSNDYLTSDSPQCACTDPFFIPTYVYLVAAVGPAPCPTQSAPANSTAPSPTYPQKINGGIDWGETQFAWSTSGLSCSEVCPGKFRIQGDIVSTGNSHVKVSTVIHKMDACVDAPRSNTRIDQTLAHENKHVTKYWTKFNSFKSQIVGDHNSLNACNTAKMELQGAVTTAMNAEATKQYAHVDHAGEYKFTWYCPSDDPTEGVLTQELQCGAPNTNCSSNTY